MPVVVAVGGVTLTLGSTAAEQCKATPRGGGPACQLVTGHASPWHALPTAGGVVSFRTALKT